MYLQMYLLVALALALETDILTADKDFLGYGVSTWTVDTLISQLERRSQSPFAQGNSQRSYVGLELLDFRPRILPPIRLRT